MLTNILTFVENANKLKFSCIFLWILSCMPNMNRIIPLLINAGTIVAWVSVSEAKFGNKKILVLTFIYKIYCCCFLDTTRPQKHDELDGVDYNFVTNASFEKSITASEFIEHGLLEGHYYGTSFGAVRTVVNSGKVCVLNMHCQVFLRPCFLFLIR